MVRPLLIALAALAAVIALSLSRAPGQEGPPLRLQSVAETSLLMEGLAQANFRGMDRLLKKKPADVESWVFLRGQALIVAETSNLLMLRPPRNSGERLWLQYASQLRESSIQMARMAAAQDYPRSRQSLVAMANVCNRCHQSFRVSTRVAVSSADGL